MSAKILLVEDNPSIMDINRKMLKREGYRVFEAETLNQAKILYEREAPNLIVLDIMLPDGDGISFCKELRRDSKTPVLFLTALGQKDERLEGLRTGGDDYLPKPYDIEELVERIAAILRRYDSVPDTITKGTLKLETFSHQAIMNGENLGLTRKEFDLIYLLVQNEDRLLTMEYLYEKVWGQPMIDDPNAIKTVISRLRNKIEPSGYGIEAVRYKGYIFTKL